MKFHLYLIDPEDIPEEETYYLITPGYCLLYTQTEGIEGTKEIEEVASLPALAKNWLSQCIDDVRRTVLAEKQDELLEAAERFRHSLGKELEAERKMAKKGKKKTIFKRGGGEQ